MGSGRRALGWGKVFLAPLWIAILVIAPATAASADAYYGFAYFIDNAPSLCVNAQAEIINQDQAGTVLDQIDSIGTTAAFNGAGTHCSANYNMPQNWLSIRVSYWGATGSQGQNYLKCYETQTYGNNGTIWYAQHHLVTFSCTGYHWAATKSHSGAYTWPGAWTYGDFTTNYVNNL